MSYQFVFLLNFLVLFFCMKFISWKQLAANLRPPLTSFFFTTPLLSARVYARNIFVNQPLVLIVLKFLLSGFFLGLIILFSRHFWQPLNYSKLLIISPFIYLFTEFIGSFAQILFRYSSKGVPPIHRHPLLSKSLGEFWGQRWNFWVRDWLRDVTKNHRKRLEKKIIITFLVSGLFHELLVNLPHFLFSREAIFGNMTLYFTIQALGLWVEKKWLVKASSKIRLLFLWAVVFLPAPLFLNRPLLIFFGIIDG